MGSRASNVARRFRTMEKAYIAMNLHFEARQAESRKITALKWKAGPFLAKSAPPLCLDLRQFVEGAQHRLSG